MAFNINGGTDTIRWATPGLNFTGTIAFRMKTTQATAQVAVVTNWSATSRAGMGFILNSTGNANKLVMQGFDGSTARVGMASATSVNDGNWHAISFNWNRTLGTTNTMYVDGISDASSAVAGAGWSMLSTSLCLGDPLDSFWASYVGDIADVALCDNRQWTADEHLAYGRGYSPKLISPNGLLRHAPLVRNANETRFGTSATVTGTTVSDHPRVMGGAV